MQMISLKKKEGIRIKPTNDNFEKVREEAFLKIANSSRLKKNDLNKEIIDKREVAGSKTSKASEKALGNNWLSEEENKAWKHLQPKTKH